MTTLALRKPHADRRMEGMVAKWYASNTAEMLKEYVELAHRIAHEIPQGSAVLEVAPGLATSALNWQSLVPTPSPDSTSVARS